MIKLVIFDMAGTSIDEDNLVYKTIASSLLKNNIEVPLMTVLEVGAGKEKRQAIHDILVKVNGELPDISIVDRIHSDFRNSLIHAYENAEMCVFPSVLQVIEFLKENQINIAFNTGYERSIALSILDKVGITVGIDIDMLCTASDVRSNRPEPDMINYICHQLKILPQNTIKIGDSAIDIEEGQNANTLLNIGVTTGAQNRDQLALAKPDFIVNDMLELIPIIKAENSIFAT